MVMDDLLDDRRDVEALPHVLSGTLRQFFEKVRFPSPPSPFDSLSLNFFFT